MNVLFLSSLAPDRTAVVVLLVEADHDPIIVETAAQANARVAHGGIDLVLLDLAAGGEALRYLRKRGQRAPLPTVCIADRRQPEVSTDALRLGVADIVARPVRSEDLLAAMDNGREFARLAERAAPPVDVPEPADGVFGASPGMRDVLSIVGRVASSRCGVLIIGEPGSGREMIARAIHRQGPRHDRPFVKVACGAADAAQFDRVIGDGLDGGTLYLEDISDLAPDLQLRLETIVRQDGAASQIRVIAAAQPRIGEWIDRGLVRRTLIESIAVVRIDLPPLRQRGQDVPLLATHFLKEACRRNEIPLKTFSRSALALMAVLPWPGNASELRSLTERLAILIPRGVVLLEDVLANVRFDGAEAIGHERGSLKEARERFERDYVTAVLQHHKGRMGEAARELGIERTNLYRKIKQLKIQWSVPD